MNVLFVTPNTSGSGEAITALDMGRQLSRSSHRVRFFAHPFNAQFLRQTAGQIVDQFSDDSAETEARWCALLGEFTPHVIVFADYPLLFLSRGGRAFLRQKRPAPLENLDAALVTLDHLGMAQGPLTLAFGPPHLELFTERLPALPERMKVLLPCPMQSPTAAPPKRGRAFRQWDVPLALPDSQRQRVRRRFVDDEEVLVFHSAPSWALEFCRRHGLPNYAYWSRVFEMFFGELPKPVVVVSVNGQSLLQASSVAGLRLLNLPQLSPDEYDALLLSSDLMITDNCISSSLGKAVCGSVPCAALRNSYRLPQIVQEASGEVKALVLEMERERAGSVFPFEVFPIWSHQDLKALGLFSNNPIQDCIHRLELYGGHQTQISLRRLLTDTQLREELQARQREYVALVGRLPAADQALLSLVE